MLSVRYVKSLLRTNVFLFEHSVELVGNTPFVNKKQRIEHNFGVISFIIFLDKVKQGISLINGVRRIDYTLAFIGELDDKQIKGRHRIHNEILMTINFMVVIVIYNRNGIIGGFILTCANEIRL